MGKRKKINAPFKTLPEAPPAACNNPQAVAMGQVLDKEASPEICSLSHWLLWKPYPLLVFLPEHHFYLGGIFTAEFKRLTSVGEWGEFSLLMLLSGLIIKLTWDRVTGADNQIYYVCTYGGSVKIWDPRTNQMV